jgi:hypothetical protein
MVSVQILSLLIIGTFVVQIEKLHAAGPPPDAKTIERAADKAALLERISTVSKTNYNNIKTWKGEYAFKEWMVILPAFREMIGVSAPVDESIHRELSGTVQFDVDVAANKLFTEFKAFSTPVFKTASGQVVTPSREFVRTHRQSIVTADSYLRFDPEKLYGTPGDYPVAESIGPTGGRMAFKEPADNATGRQWNNVVDPRQLYSNVQGPFAWDKLDAYAQFLRRPTMDAKRQIVENALKVFHESASNPSLVWIRYDLPGENGPLATEWLVADSKAAFNIINCAQVDPDGWRRWDITHEYELSQETYVPSLVRMVVYQYGTTDPQAWRELSLISSSVNTPLDDGSFTIARFGLETGERVLDKQEGTMKVVKDTALVDVEEFNEANVSPFEKLRFTALVANTIIVLVIAALFLWRWRQRVSLKSPSN